MRRRDFLRLGSAAAAGIVPGSLSGIVHSDSSNHIRRTVALGNTGIEVSDIAFGGSRLSDPDLVRYAFDRGVTYFDTAESYRGGSSEHAVGKALADVRSEVIIASKTKAWSNEDQNAMMQALEASLKRLRTDYIDIYYNHAVNDVDRMRNEQWWEFTERAKQQGKIRFRGMSGHGSRLVECIDYSLDNNLVDVILASFNFSQDTRFKDEVRHLFHYVAIQTDLERVLLKAKSAGVGVAVMKILMGARLNDIRSKENYGITFSQAALRWVLTSGKADVAVISMTDHNLIDEYLGASGAEQVSSAEVSLLAEYMQLQNNRYCRQGCGVCESSCALEVDISDVLRARMYEVDYRDRQLALAAYSELSNDASVCVSCVDQTCISACPNELPVASLTQDAAQLLG